MKKVVLASLLAVASVAPFAQTCFAQAQAPAAQAGGQVQMNADEYAKYNAISTAAEGAPKAAAAEDYLKAYPNSAVKGDVLATLLYTYSQLNNTAQALDAADRLLQVDPNNLRALTFEVYLRRADADKMTDPAAKQAALDKVAAYAQTGLNASKPASMAQGDFDTLKKAAMPTFESAIADDDLAKKDNAGAIAALKTEIDSVPVGDTQKPSPVLQDMLTLANAYYTSTPPDWVNCAWWAARAGYYAPDNLKPDVIKLAQYCYAKYHGSKEGYEQITQLVPTNLDPPAALANIKPAPKPADIVSNLIATTPDLSTLAVSDREFVLQYGNNPDPKCAGATPAAATPAATDASAAPAAAAPAAPAAASTCPTNADKAFNSVKGKSVEFPDVLVVSATTTKVMVAVSDDAVQGKTPDFEFDLKEPLADAKVPAAGTKVSLTGTYASYTSAPLLITMSDGAIVPKKATPTKAPVRRAPARRR